jgi:hypothetical protein
MKLYHYAKTINLGMVTFIADTQFVFFHSNHLSRMSVKNVLWRAFIPFCTNPTLCNPDCRWNRLSVVVSLLSEVSDRTQNILNSVTLTSVLYFECMFCEF